MARILRRALVVLVVVILGFVGYGLLTPKQLDKGMHSGTAIVACGHLRTACEAYRLSEANVKHDWPRHLRDLVHPPFGGASFLEYGESNLIDPWGKRYVLSFDTDTNGQEYPIIWTVNKEGILLSQFGFGPKARPQK